MDTPEHIMLRHKTKRYSPDRKCRYKNARRISPLICLWLFGSSLRDLLVSMFFKANKKSLLARLKIA